MFKKYQWIIFFFILVAAVWMRASSYENLIYSMGANDTMGYLEISELKFPSWTFFTSIRSATLPLVYKILKPTEGYHLLVIAEPAQTGARNKPIPQPGFGRVVFAQFLLAVLSWSSLALVLYKRLAHPLSKILAASMVLLFGFAPQMADWDYLLMSESISFSLFALILALTIEFTFELALIPPATNWKLYTTGGLLCAAVAAWVFTRDTNAYLLLYTLGWLAFLFVVAIWRKRLPVLPLAMVTLLLGSTFIFHQATFRASDRWLLPFLNNFTYNILPKAGRMQFFESRGMPVSPTLLGIEGVAEHSGIYDIPDFMTWTRQYGLSTYTQFLLRSPTWAGLTLLKDMPGLFKENIQPYYRTAKFRQANILDIFGDILHPRTSFTLWIDLVLLSIVIGLAWSLRSRSAITWAGLTAWLVTGSLLLLAAGYLGEVRSILRHAMVGIVPLRLSVWLLLAIAVDLALAKVIHRKTSH
jgi:hypothetical protein